MINDKVNGESKKKGYPDGLVQLNLLLIILIRIKGVQTDVVEDQLLPNLQHGS